MRTAEASDVARLQEIFRDASWSNDGDRALLTEHPEFLVLGTDAVADGRTRVAVLDGRVVGFASLSSTGADAELDDLFVDPAVMRTGVGRALIADAIGLARSRGMGRISVDANDHARSFYEAVGFVAVGRVDLDHGVAERMTLAVAPSAPATS